MGVYAASIGKVAEQLTSAERKQALLNAVMEQSASISTAPATGPGAALAQSQVAQQNAQVAVGDFFAPVWRDWANLQVDAINRIMGKYDEFAARTRDVMNLTADMANTKGSDPVMVNRLSDLSAAMAEVSIAMNNGVPNASAYADALTDIALSAYNTGVVTEQQTNLIELAVEGIRAETKAARDAAAARALANEQAQRASPYYQQLAAAHREVATAEELAAAEATLAKSSMEAFAQSMVGANAYAQALAGGLSTVQAQASATAGVIYDLRGALASLSTVSNGNVGGPDALDQVLPQINALAPQLVPELGLDAALAKVDELKIANRELYDTLKAQGYTENDILVALRANVNETQKWASGLGNVQTSAAGINKEFDKLVSATQSVIADSMDLGVTWEGMNSTQGGDSINENAKRLAAIANEGLQGQPWLDEFIAEVPGVYADLMLKQAAGVDVKTAAQQIMAEFQQGLRPELLDRDMIKQRVKDMIIGQENAAKLATEIAQELATEMNIPFQQALSAASSALGVAPTGAAGESATGGTVDMTGSGNAAGTTFAAGFAANADGTILIAGIVAKMETQLPRIYSAGAIHGTQWGAGFMSTVETSIGVPLVNLLTVLITPGVLAAIKANESQTTPP